VCVIRPAPSRRHLSWLKLHRPVTAETRFRHRNRNPGLWDSSLELPQASRDVSPLPVPNKMVIGLRSSRAQSINADEHSCQNIPSVEPHLQRAAEGHLSARRTLVKKHMLEFAYSPASARDQGANLRYRDPSSRGLLSTPSDQIRFADAALVKDAKNELSSSASIGFGRQVAVRFLRRAFLAQMLASHPIVNSRSAEQSRSDDVPSEPNADMLRSRGDESKALLCLQFITERS